MSIHKKLAKRRDKKCKQKNLKNHIVYNVLSIKKIFINLQTVLETNLLIKLNDSEYIKLQNNFSK